EPADAAADGAGADHGDLASGGAEAVDLVGQRLKAGRLQGAVGAGEHVGADLDDDGVGQGDDFLADGVEHAGVLGGQAPMPDWKSARGPAVKARSNQRDSSSGADWLSMRSRTAAGSSCGKRASRTRMIVSR